MNALPYESATSGERALREMQKLLRAFGCSKFGSMIDDAAGTLLVQFEYRGQPVSVQASTKGYAASWLRAHPHSSRSHSTLKQYQDKAMNIASMAVYSILRDWIKGQVAAIETGVLSFEGAFLGQLLLASGKTVLEHVTSSKLLAIEPPRGAA